MRATIVYVTEIRPYPLYGGMCIDVYNMLISLCEHYNVIVLSPPIPAECALYQQVLAWYHLPDYSVGLRDKVWNGLYLLLRRPEWQQVIEMILPRHQPDIVWFSYGHWGQYVSLVHRHGALAVMRPHNVQSELTRQRATVTPWGLTYLLTQFRAWVEAYHEQHFFRYFDCVASLTEDDRRYHNRFVDSTCSALIPGYLDEQCYAIAQPIERANDLLILRGSFNSFQNSQGARWFLHEIWPLVRAMCPMTRLQLVGIGAGQLALSASDMANVECYDSVPDIVPYLQQATVAIVPILHGSGIRFKVLEALACAIPIVSTSLGAQGIAVEDGQSIMLADRANDFADAVVALLHDPQQRCRQAQHGVALFKQAHTKAVVGQQIQAIVAQLLGTTAQQNMSSWDEGIRV